MIPPTSIDGTDITGATIDGTDVTEITVDGQTVFTAEPSNLPVAYSNLVAWYPFDSATYGGSNADDVTALFNPAQSGDSTAYDGTVNGATYQSSAGVTDINAGANSGAFDFDGNDKITTANFGLSDTTLSVWFNSDLSSYPTVPDNPIIWGDFRGSSDKYLLITLIGSDFSVRVDDGNNSFTGVATANFSANVWHQAVASYDSTTGTTTGYLDGNFINDIGYTQGVTFDSNVYTMGGVNRSSAQGLEGKIDDARIYNRALTGTEISDIYNNTKP